MIALLMTWYRTVPCKTPLVIGLIVEVAVWFFTWKDLFFRKLTMICVIINLGT